MKNEKDISSLNYTGNTPFVRLKVKELPRINLYAKLEYLNPTGSVKDRAASYIITKLLNDSIITEETAILESSSGNFAIALAASCIKNGLKFIAVVDPHITSINEMLIRSFGAEVVKVNIPDQTGGYLLNRLQKIKELQIQIENSYWVNQYSNPLNAEAYYSTLGTEILTAMDFIDYVFIGVSSGGTITGVSRRIKEKFPEAKIIAVDALGSMIFESNAKKRLIPGIGSSIKPDILKFACIDDYILIDDCTTVKGCKNLLKSHCIFAGGSSGSVYSAILKYFQDNDIEKNEVNVVTMFADRGERYIETIYNEKWCSALDEATTSIKN